MLDEVVSKCIQHGTGGGLSHLSITSREWHDENKQSAKIIFGFESYDQLLTHVECFFTWVDTNDVRPMRKIKKGQEKGKFKLSHLTEFERCLVAKMFAHFIPVRNRLALIWGVSRHAITRAIKTWLPYWGKANGQISNLFINEAYLDAEHPEEYHVEKMVDAALLMDGKDYMVEVKRV